MNKEHSNDEQKKGPDFAVVAAKKKKKSYVCPYPECQKVFGESGNLKRHLRSHV